jgi:hypothetical protein
MNEGHLTNVIAVVIFAGFLVFGFPALRRSWQQGEALGRRFLEEVEGRSFAEQIGIYWRYARWPIFGMVIYLAFAWLDSN